MTADQLSQPMVVPSTQRAIVQTSYGPLRDVLRLDPAFPVIGPEPRQVQIAVHAASINPIDWQMIEGNRRLIAKRLFPFVPLFDIAGIVTAVGSDVTRFNVGDRVHADNKLHGGGASEYVSVDEDLVSHIPGSLSFAEAAALPLAGQTALLALQRADVGPNSTVCIIGASGGVGSFAVQIAKARGAGWVIGVCSAKNAAYVRSLGADEIVDYRSTSLMQAVSKHSLNAVIDCVGGREQWLAAKNVLRARGRFATISRDEDGVVTVGSAIRMITTILARQFASRFGRTISYIPIFLDASHNLMDEVDSNCKDYSFTIHIDGSYDFSLSDVITALEVSKAGRVTGKLVVNVR